MSATTKIYMRRDTAANWTSANTLLASGEQAFETDTRKRKTGDGVTTWTSLAYDVPTVHSATHAVGGTDVLTPLAIGAQPFTFPADYSDVYAYGHQTGAAAGATSIGYGYVNRVGVRVRAPYISNRATSGNIVPQYVYDAITGTNKVWTPGTVGTVLIDGPINEVLLARTAGTQTQDVIGMGSAMRTLLRRLRAKTWFDDTDASQTYTAGWTTSTAATGAYSGAGERTSATAGDTVTIAGYTGTSILLAILGWTSNPGSMTVGVGGTNYATLNANGIAESSGTLPSGLAWQPHIFRVDGLPAGTKSVVLTLTAGTIFYDGYGDPGNTTPPTIIMAKAIKLPSYTAINNIYTKATGDTQVDALNAVLDTIAGEAEFGGSNQIKVVDHNGTVDLTTMLAADGYNLNNMGQGVVAQNFSRALSQFTYRAGMGSQGFVSTNVSPIYGDGSDGAVTVSTAITLTTDMHYKALTIAAGGSIRTNGFRVFVRGTLNIAATGALHCDGFTSVGGEAPAISGSSNGSLGYGYGAAGAGSPGVAGTNSPATYGGAGGAGGPSLGAGGVGGTATPPNGASAPYNNRTSSLISGQLSGVVNNVAQNIALTGGASGGTGGSSTGSVGAGGGGAGVMVLACNTITNSGRISCNGGAGFVSTALNNSGPGGGGGGGGVVIVVTSSYAGTAPTALAGAGGAAPAGFNPGNAGGAGTVIMLSGDRP